MINDYTRRLEQIRAQALACTSSEELTGVVLDLLAFLSQGEDLEKALFGPIAGAASAGTDMFERRGGLPLVA